MTSSTGAERRVNRELREVLDELVAHVRYVSNHARTMGPEELAYAEERLEWLADEVWRTALAGDGRTA